MSIKEEKRRTKNELIEERRKYKKRAGIFFILLILLGIYIGWNFIKEGLSTTDKLKEEMNCQLQLETYFVNQTNQSISDFKKELCEESTITRTINSFFDRFLQLDNSWIIKFLIFLGIVYLIQITFALVMDILEVFMLIFVIIKRIYKWIKSKVIKENDKRN